MRITVIKLSFILTLALLSFVAVRVASANSAPPPSVVWFQFELPTLEQGPDGLPFAGLQLHGCADTACAEPALLQEIGRCDLPGCLAGPPLPPASGPASQSLLECYGDRCRSQSYSYPRLYFRLALQPHSGSALLLSDVQALPESYAKVHNWRVRQENDRLTLVETEDLATPSIYKQPFWLNYLLTLGSELTVALILWFVWLRRRLGLSRLMLFVALATSLSYPAVYFSPSLVPFANPGERTLFYTAISAGLFLGALAWAFFTRVLWPTKIDSSRAAKNRRWLVGWASAIVALGCVLACPIYIFVVMYASNYEVVVSGIPAMWAIGLAEVYAFSFEALSYRLWSRGSLGWLAALSLSLLANLASYGLGLLW